MKILKRFVELNWNKSIDLQQPNRTKPNQTKPKTNGVKSNGENITTESKSSFIDCNESFCLMGWLGLRLLNFCSLCIFHHRYSFQSTLCIVLWISCSLSHNPENMEQTQKKKTRLWSSSVSTCWFFLFREKFPKWNSVQNARNTLQLNPHN